MACNGWAAFEEELFPSCYLTDLSEVMSAHWWGSKADGVPLIWILSAPQEMSDVISQWECGAESNSWIGLDLDVNFLCCSIFNMS